MKLLFPTVLTLLAGSTFAAPTVDADLFDKAMGSLIVGRDSVNSCGQCQEHLDVCMKASVTSLTTTEGERETPN